jgi:hypothetical protein
MADTPLDNEEDGYAQVHYLCSGASCFYDHGTVQLSSTAPLTRTLWASTILHELGHVAGLNHVSRQDEAMYPIISDTSPETYMPGDIQGLQALAQARSSSSSSDSGTATSRGAVTDVLRSRRHEVSGARGRRW